MRYIYHKELDKASFQNNMAYGAYKYLPRRTASNKALPDNAFARASNPQYDWHQRERASMVYKFFDKRSRDTIHTGTVIISEDQQLANDLCRSIHGTFKKR